MKLGFRLFTWAIFATLVFTVPAIGQDGPTPASLYNEGVAALKAKEYNNALELFEQALEKADPESDEQIVNLASKNGAIAAYYSGRDARRDNKLDEGLEIYEKGIAMNPMFWGNYDGKARVLNSKNDAAGAMNAFIQGSQAAAEEGNADKASELMDNATIFVSKVYTSNKWDETIELGNSFLEHGESADVRFYLARALKENNQLDKALEHANKAIELAEGGAEGRNYFAQAEIYEAMGNTSAAIAAYKKVPSGTYGEMAQYKVNQMANQ